VRISSNSSRLATRHCLWQTRVRLTTPTATPEKPSLLSRLLRRGIFGQFALAALLFGPAGTFDFWQGWTFIIVNFTGTVIFCAYFYKHDPQLLARRMLTKETAKAQKFIMLLVRVLYGAAFVLPGCDFRLGWTRSLTGPVPWWLTLLALLLISGCHLFFIRVMNANRFAASIIQVETAQTVVSTGPYRFVRHPYYSGAIVFWFATPLALGSWVSLPAFVLLVPLLVWRLLNEEQFLRRELPGYAEYCQHTRHRLIPCVW
jgi:protein-S-isoprenylcysteine O-methyltransferase Ste14